MSVQAWALVGVAIGAVLGGLAQIVADWLRSRREATNRTREVRREAYTELLAAESHGFNDLNMAFIFAKTKEVSLDQSLPPLIAGRAAQARLNAAVAQVALVGPKDTRNAAADLMSASSAQATRVEVEGNSVQEARDRFVALAKRDLGIGANKLQT